MITKNGLYSNLLNTQVKQENYEINVEDDYIESDDDVMDGQNINKEYALPSTSQTKNKQISIKVSTYKCIITLFNSPFVFNIIFTF